MATIADLTEALDNFFKRKIREWNPRVCTVLSVDKTDHTCEVEPLSGKATFKRVRLKPTADAEVKGLIAYPKVGSYVVIGSLSDPNDTFVLMTSETDLYLIGGDKYSLLKGEDLIEQVKKLQNTVDAMVQAFNSLMPLGNAADGGTVITTLKTALVGKSTGNFSNLLNENVKHGE